MVKLSVIIVSYNVKYYLEQCLESVVRSSCGINTEIIVVDNNSSDNTVKYLTPRFRDVLFIQNKDNCGFAKANNQAIRISKGEYVVLLNPDTILGEDVLKTCIDFLDNNKMAGATGVRMLRTDGSFALESRRGIPTPFTSFCKMTGLCSRFPKSRTFGRYYMQYLDENLPNQIEVISGACMFIRRTTLAKSGLLDEDYFMYGEDIDLSYRMLMTGQNNYYLPVSILHYKGESTNKTSFRYVTTFYKAMLIFFEKHYGHYNLFVTVPIKLSIYAKGAASFFKQKLFSRNQKHMSRAEYIRQYRFLLVSTGENLEKMQKICESNRISYRIEDLPAGRGNSIEGDIKTDGFNYVVFDTDIYSYKNILEFFRHCGSQRKAPLIGTFSSANNRIITGEFVLN